MRVGATCCTHEQELAPCLFLCQLREDARIMVKTSQSLINQGVMLGVRQRGIVQKTPVGILEYLGLRELLKPVHAESFSGHAVVPGNQGSHSLPAR